MLLRQPSISVKRARRILGTSAKRKNNKQVKELIKQIEVLSDIVLAQVADSKIKGGIDISAQNVHTRR